MRFGIAHTMRNDVMRNSARCTVKQWHYNLIMPMLLFGRSFGICVSTAATLRFSPYFPVWHSNCSGLLQNTLRHQPAFSLE